MGLFSGVKKLGRFVDKKVGGAAGWSKGMGLAGTALQAVPGVGQVAGGALLAGAAATGAAAQAQAQKKAEKEYLASLQPTVPFPPVTETNRPLTTVGYTATPAVTVSPVTAGTGRPLPPAPEPVPSSPPWLLIGAAALGLLLLVRR